MSRALAGRDARAETVAVGVTSWNCSLSRPTTGTAPLLPTSSPLNTAALAVQMMRNRYDERRVLDEIHKYRSWDLSKGNWQKVKGRVLDRVAQALHPHTHTTQHRARVQTGPTR